MADDAMFPGPKGKGGIPTWLLIGGAGVGILAIIMLVTKGSGGSGTTAAGASINAALGSIQDENQNLLGTVQAGALANMTNFQGVNSNLTSGFNTISGTLASNQQDLLTRFDTVDQNQALILSSVVEGVVPKLNQIIDLQNQLKISTGQDAVNLSGQIAAMQNDVKNTINTAAAGNQASLNYITNQIATGFNITTQQFDYMSNLQTAGIGATWSQYNTIMHTIGHALGVPGM